MRWLLFFFGVLLVLGPLRRPLLRAWRFTLPAALGAAGSWLALTTVMRPDEAWLVYALPPFVAVGAAVALRPLLDDLFGKGP
jgi:hypothetical protein